MYFNLAFMRAKVQKKRLSPMNGGYSFSSKIKKEPFPLQRIASGNGS